MCNYWSNSSNNSNSSISSGGVNRGEYDQEEKDELLSEFSFPRKFTELLTSTASGIVDLHLYPSLGHTEGNEHVDDTSVLSQKLMLRTLLAGKCDGHYDGDDASQMSQDYGDRPRFFSNFYPSIDISKDRRLVATAAGTCEVSSPAAFNFLSKNNVSRFGDEVSEMASEGGTLELLRGNLPFGSHNPMHLWTRHPNVVSMLHII